MILTWVEQVEWVYVFCVRINAKYKPRNNWIVVYICQGSCGEKIENNKKLILKLSIFYIDHQAA